MGTVMIGCAVPSQFTVQLIDDDVKRRCNDDDDDDDDDVCDGAAVRSRSQASQASH